jgi:4-carboxymuconolactone decarboxylase
MAASLIIGYGVVFDNAGRVLLLRRREHESLWPGAWWLPGDVTPLDEEPDDTVPRIFEHLLRQRVRTGYAYTVYGEEPSSGRHTIHNAYVVTVENALDGAPEDESNPFDAMEWWDVKAAARELPEPQAELLQTIIERLEQGWTFDDDTDLDALFAEDPVPTPTRSPTRTHSQRRIAGAEILSELSGQDKFAEAIESGMGPFGTYLVDHIWGDIWQDGLLSRRDRSLAAMSAAGALMQIDGFAFNASIGERNGLSRDEIVDVCVQLTVECGFPFGNLALTRVLSDWAKSDAPYQPAAAIGKDDAQRRTDAAEVSEALTGRRIDERNLAEDAQRQLGSVGRLTIDWSWGDVWSRGQLSRRDRSLAVLAMHLSMGRERELESDLKTARRLGCSWDELDGVIAIASAFCGLPRASDAARILQRLRD